MKKIYKLTVAMAVIAVIGFGIKMNASATTYATKDRLSSRGIFEYEDIDSGDKVLINSNDFITIADAIDNSKNEITAKKEEISESIEVARLICR